MSNKNWTLIVGCSAFLLVGIVATLVGATIQTATYRAVVASCIGGICGFFLDYFIARTAELPAPQGRRPPPSAASAPPESQDP